MYSKRSGNFYTVPVKEPKKYSYIHELQAAVVQACLRDHGNLYRSRNISEDDPRHISRTLAPESPKPTAEIAAMHEMRRRF